MFDPRSPARPAIGGIGVFPVRGAREWIGPAASFLVHAALVVLVFAGFRSEARPEDRSSPAEAVSAAPREVSMIYIPPPRAAAPEPSPPRRPPAPDAVQAPENRASRGPAVSEDAPSAPGQAALTPPQGEMPEAAPGPATRPPESGTPAPRPASPTLESEARRLFGNPGVRTGNMGGPRLGIGSAAELARNYVAERSDCRMAPRPARPADAAVEMGVATGRVLRSDHRTPVANAFLQVLGTPWSTFTDGNGLYHLEFDASLVDNCRTQTVRVTADGYQMRDLILGVGYAPDDVVLQRF